LWRQVAHLPVLVNARPLQLGQHPLDRLADRRCHILRWQLLYLVQALGDLVLYR
jgi:hypothetical protein